MPNLTVTIPHQLSREEARHRVQREVAQLHQHFEGKLGYFEERWLGDTMHFTLSVTGLSIPGRLEVEDQMVRIEVELPWPLAMLAQVVKPRIEQQGRRLLGHP